MSDDELRVALLNQENPMTSADELKLLRDLMESEQRRAGRLVRWTVAAWSAWGVCLVLMLLLPMWMARQATPAGQPPVPATQPGLLIDLVTSTVSIVLIVGAIALPVAGVVLLILSVAASRSAMSRGWAAARVARTS